MEALKSSCPSCGVVYFWTGYKTGLGKTPEQLAEMKRRETVCRECGKDGLKTELDHETAAGQTQDAMAGFLAKLIGDLVSKKEGGP